MHKACAYILLVPNATSHGRLPYPWGWHWREGRVGMALEGGESGELDAKGSGGGGGGG